MKIRSGHIILLVVGLTTAFVLFAVWRARTIELQRGGAADSPASGTLPPIDAAPDRLPVIEVETTELDMGLIPNDRETTVPLRVFNRGKALLRINDIQSSCACTRGKVPPGRAEVPPGGESAIDVTMYPARVVGFHSLKTLTVYSNDPMHPSVEVRVEARIKPEFELIPETLDVGEIPKGESREVSLLMRQVTDLPVEITGLRERGAEEGVKGDLELSFVRRPEAEWAAPGRAEYAITIKLPATLPPGAFSRWVEIGTTIHRFPWAPYEIKGEIRAPYQISPAYPSPLLLRPAPGGELSGTVTVTAAEPVEIVDIASEPELFSGTFRSGTAKTEALLDVVPVAGLPAGQIKGVVRFNVKLGEKQYPEQISVRGMVPPRRE
jgi:hypothetical protein